MQQLTVKLFILGWAATTLFFATLFMPIFYLAALFFEREKVYDVYKLYKLILVILAGGVLLWIALT